MKGIGFSSVLPCEYCDTSMGVLRETIVVNLKSTYRESINDKSKVKLEIYVAR